MISTVTISTVSIVTNAALAGSLALMGIFLLMAFLVQKELESAAGDRFQSLVRTLDIGIAPVFVAFILIEASRVMEILY